MDHLLSLSHSLQSTLARHHEINSSLCLSSLDHSTVTTAAPVAVPPSDTAETASDILAPESTLRSSQSQRAAVTPTGNSTQGDSDYRTELRDDPTPVPDSDSTAAPLLPPTRPVVPPPPPHTTVPSTEFQAKASLIRSQFRRCHQILSEREAVLLKELEARVLLQQHKQLDFLRSVERIDCKVTLSLSSLFFLSSCTPGAVRPLLGLTALLHER